MKSIMSKKLKKALVSFVTIVLCFNNFAAIVSDNDGSAFVTKSEFEAMKEEFAAQVDNYNSSIDGKIDGAISAYLAGIKLERKVPKDVINSTWKNVTAVNGALDNSFKVPTFDLMFAIASQQVQNEWGKVLTTKDAVGQVFIKANYQIVQTKYTEDWSKTKNCYRNLVTATGADPNNMGDLIWAGQALRYNEKWSIVRIINALDNTISWGWLDQPSVKSYDCTIRDLTTLRASGYITDWDDIKETAWPISYLWNVYAKGSTTIENTYTYTFKNSQLKDVFSTSIVLDADPNAKNATTRYDHVIAHDKESEWRVSNTAWPNYINAVSETDITASKLLSAGTANQKARTLGIAFPPARQEQWGLGLSLNATLTTLNNDQTPNLGMLPSKIKAKTIYQDNDKRDIDTGKKKIYKDRPTLEHGLQLLAAEEGAVIEWTPVFDYTHVHNGTTTYKDNGHNVDVYFSIGPFKDGVSTDNPLKISDDDNLDTTKDSVTTKDGKVKVKFKMPSNGLIYVKWIPHNAGTYLDKDWIVNLKLESCNTYFITAAD